MRLAILSQSRRLYSTHRLLAAARRERIEAHVVDYLECRVRMTTDRLEVVSRGKPLSSFDAIIPRVPSSETAQGCMIVRQLEHLGARSPNGADAIERSRDKLRAMQDLGAAGLPIPPTAVAHPARETRDLVEDVGGAPVVVKLIEGTQGVGVILCETLQAAEAVVDAIRSLRGRYLVQRFIAEARGSDLRYFVVGDTVVAAMRRTAQPGEFRSNLHRGGEVEGIAPDPDEAAIAVRAAKTLGLGVAGVDLLRSEDGPMLLEVNSSPGLEGIEKATGIDVARAIVRHVAQR
ncbi:MAG: RimK family alpha-L-glutamate ligase [Myxococcales bacterium]|nr:RimK family alpha-L-glutamate ligase [Myxococcales bacterium]